MEKESTTVHKHLRRLKILLRLSVGVSIILLVSYFWNFNSSFSNDKGDWGTFGDFVGGTIGMIFNVVGTYVLYRLTIVIEGENERRLHKQIELQKELNEETLSLQRDLGTLQEKLTKKVALFELRNKFLDELYIEAVKGYEAIEPYDYVSFHRFKLFYENFHKFKLQYFERRPIEKSSKEFMKVINEVDIELEKTHRGDHSMAVLVIPIVQGNFLELRDKILNNLFRQNSNRLGGILN